MITDPKYFAKLGTTPQDEQNMLVRLASESNHDIVEIGVLNGDTARNLCRGAKASVIVTGIDPVIPDSMEASLIGNVDLIKENTKAYPNFRFIKDYSFNVAKTWTSPVGLIFIDGDHTYDAVKTDYIDWMPHVVPGGHVCFHDSCMFRKGANFHVGSSQFVDWLIENDPGLEFVESIFSLTVFRKK